MKKIKDFSSSSSEDECEEENIDHDSSIKN